VRKILPARLAVARRDQAALTGALGGLGRAARGAGECAAEFAWLLALLLTFDLCAYMQMILAHGRHGVNAAAASAREDPDTCYEAPARGRKDRNTCHEASAHGRKDLDACRKTPALGRKDRNTCREASAHERKDRNACRDRSAGRRLTCDAYSMSPARRRTVGHACSKSLERGRMAGTHSWRAAAVAHNRAQVSL
jgi:hypothetical protein